MTLSSGFDARVALLAVSQASALSRGQALGLGATDPLIARRVRSGRWRRVHTGVYVVGGAPPSWLQEVWSALLAIGPRAAVTHETALRLHGIEKVALRPHTFTVAHGAHPRVTGARVHQVDDLRPDQVTSALGLPVSRVERALVEVAATMGARQLADVVDDAVASRRTTYPRVSTCLGLVARPGKRGVRRMAELLDSRADGAAPAQSQLEQMLFAALRAGGLPTPRRQMPLPGRGAVEGLVDAGYRDARLIIEADGRRWHTRVRQLKSDHQRDAEAARVGWLTLRFMHEQIVQEPGEVCAVVADVRASRLVGLDRSNLATTGFGLAGR
jgi:very-short-patch-repair endonuclease